MAEIFDSTHAQSLMIGARKARQAIAQGDLIIMPTDTVYGICADAFNTLAVQRLLDAKGRGRQSPPPVMVADIASAKALAEDMPEAVERLAAAFWPGALTIVLPARGSLDWDLGETGGTVALRIPNHEIALEILRETGPLAVSSANITGKPPVSDAQEAQEVLGDNVQVILALPNESPADGAQMPASTIIDATQVTNNGGILKILRPGPITISDLADVCPELTIAVAPKQKTSSNSAQTEIVDSATDQPVEEA